MKFNPSFESNTMLRRASLCQGRNVSTHPRNKEILASAIVSGGVVMLNEPVNEDGISDLVVLEQGNEGSASTTAVGTDSDDVLAGALWMVEEDPIKIGIRALNALEKSNAVFFVFKGIAGRAAGCAAAGQRGGRTAAGGAGLLGRLASRDVVSDVNSEGAGQLLQEQLSRDESVEAMEFPGQLEELLDVIVQGDAVL